MKFSVKGVSVKLSAKCVLAKFSVKGVSVKLSVKCVLVKFSVKGVSVKFSVKCVVVKSNVKGVVVMSQDVEANTVRLKEHGQDVLLLEKIPVNVPLHNGSFQSQYK